MKDSDLFRLLYEMANELVEWAPVPTPEGYWMASIYAIQSILGQYQKQDKQGLFYDDDHHTG